MPKPRRGDTDTVISARSPGCRTAVRSDTETAKSGAASETTISRTSGDTPGTDAHTDLKMVISLPASGVKTVVVTHTYGLPCPYGQDCGAGGCIWDCETVPDNQVGVTDFLAILAQWGQVGTSCDFDGGGVGVTDFLELLANWGPCP